ncbi:fructosamine kinase family protein [Luteipulveratus mongoliensis]|uniref:Fructosamine kinase n=1 Tax=Luteipulveratus mongoliensis TaxID=571913 RepID=A0A0K1JPK2_9MICO|nr:fructosamine kinase family protein [Luteipulveratus mongoliensis]AKU18644.1 fructosamine kinase [Luteipulveratus mongoliensis]
MPYADASSFVKASSLAPDGYFAWEAAGLRWLAAADGVPAVEVLETHADRLVLQRIQATAPSMAGAEALGRGLARTHLAGAPAYGSGPDGWEGDGWLGPLSEPLPLLLGAYESWGEMYADLRLSPLVAEGVRRGAFSADDQRDVERLSDRLRDGDYDTGEAPARLHGDLWSGNVMWTPDGAVVIDPAAHGGHREADLAMLTMFGGPHLDRIVAAYDEESPLVDEWRDRLQLHRIHPLLLHAVIFGGGYIGQAMAAVRAYL